MSVGQWNSHRGALSYSMCLGWFNDVRDYPGTDAQCTLCGQQMVQWSATALESHIQAHSLRNWAYLKCVPQFATARRYKSFLLLCSPLLWGWTCAAVPTQRLQPKDMFNEEYGWQVDIFINLRFSLPTFLMKIAFPWQIKRKMSGELAYDLSGLGFILAQGAS